MMSAEEWTEELRDLYGSRDAYLNQRKLIKSYREMRQTTTAEKIEFLRGRIETLQKELEDILVILGPAGEQEMQRCLEAALKFEAIIRDGKKLRKHRDVLLPLILAKENEIEKQEIERLKAKRRAEEEEFQNSLSSADSDSIKAVEDPAQKIEGGELENFS